MKDTMKFIGDTKITSTNKVTIPKAVMQVKELKVGDRIGFFELDNGDVVIYKLELSPVMD